MSGSVSTAITDAAALFEAYHPRIYRYVLSLMHDPAEAEDVTSEAFLRAYRQRDSLRDAGATMSWLYRIATNICLDRLRQRTRRAPLESAADPEDLDLSDPDAPSLQKVIEQHEMSACVQQYLVDLPDDYRAVILFHDMHGLTGPEILEILGVPAVNSQDSAAPRPAQAESSTPGWLRVLP